MSDPTAARPARAIWPLAIAPPALAAALLIPGPLDPFEPLSGAPPAVPLLLLLGAVAPALTIGTARRAIAQAPERNRLLASAGALAAIATALSTAVTVVLAPALLVRSGGAWILLAGSALAVPALAAWLVLEPRSRFRWGLLAGEAVVALVLAFALRAPRAPDEALRQAMTLAPGWGSGNLGAITGALLRDAAAGADPSRLEARVRATETALEAMIAGGAFAPPYVEWGDDARLVRAWVASVAAASPGLPAADADRYRRIAVTERLVFAESPASSLEPFTRGGVLARQALSETRDLGPNADLRFRVHVAWTALATLTRELREPELERRAIATVRGLFAANGLDRTHVIHLLTYALERRRLVEAGDPVALLAFFEAAAGDTGFPERLRSSFAREAAFLREHPGDDHRPAIQLLRARLAADGGFGDLEAAAALYREVLGKWPESSVAALARAELAALEPAQ